MGCICDVPEMVVCIKNTYPRMRHCPCCMKALPETCTDEEGNVLIVERIPWNGKPMDMTIDLDKINIDREVCMLEKAHGEKPWTTEYARQRIREQIIEYMKNKKEKGD